MKFKLIHILFLSTCAYSAVIPREESTTNEISDSYTDVYNIGDSFYPAEDSNITQYITGQSGDQEDYYDDEDEDGFDDDDVFGSEKYDIENFNITSSGQGTDDDPAIYIVSTGLSKKHSDFQEPHFKKIKRVKFFNANPEYSPFKFEDWYNRNDENGQGSASAGACCSPSYGIHKTPGVVSLTSVKCFDKFGRGDPAAFVRAMSWIPRDIKRNGYKKVVVLIAPPTFITPSTNTERHHYQDYHGKFKFQRRLITLIDASVSQLLLRTKKHSDVLVILHAGDFKKNLNYSIFYPSYRRLSKNDNVLIMGAKTRGGLLRLKNSNWGDKIVNGYLPGEEVPTWEPTPTRRGLKKYPYRERPTLISGTSMSAAKMAGTALNLFSDGLTANEIKSYVVDNFS